MLRIAARLPGALQRPPESEEDDGPGAADRMSFLEHLDELRKRIVHALLYTAAGVIVGFAFINRISDFLLGPTRSVLPPGRTLIYTQPGEAFGFDIQIALIAGVVLAAPGIMYQVWLFIAPGLYTKEKKLAIPFVLGSLRSAGTGSRTLVGLLLGLGFFLLQRLIESGTIVFQLNPVVLAWLPTALLMAVSLGLLARAR